MRPQTQKPDGNTPQYRKILKSLREYGRLDYIEPPSGVGCDFMIYIPGETIYLEVKMPGEEENLTKREKALQEICQRFDIDYYISSNPASFEKWFMIRLGCNVAA